MLYFRDVHDKSRCGQMNSTLFFSDIYKAEIDWWASVRENRNPQGNEHPLRPRGFEQGQPTKVSSEIHWKHFLSFPEYF